MSAHYNREQRREMLRIADRAIRYGLQHGRPPAIDISLLDPALQAQRASFVTLKENGRLRGCIGSLEAYRPLALDVNDNAFNAAFRDPRFPPVNEAEVDRLDIHISVLSPPEPMSFTDEADLLRRIRPGVDGLILEDRGRRGTFLPSVWEELPDAVSFLRHLKLKAGLPPDWWSDTLKLWRYRTEEFSAADL
jgi:AmmeMemoRadiSam system protein A